MASRSWTYAALLASLSMVGVFAVDAYLPAFAAIGRDLGATPLEVQQTLSIYLFVYAFMMLWHGSLSDALGRRPVVLAGLAVYGVASLGCALAGNIQTLWLFRGVQGASAGTGLVVSRAIVRDRFRGAEAQRLMAQITLVFGIAPAIAPVMGGAMLDFFNWRAIFWMLVVIVATMLLLTAKLLPETLPKPNRTPLNPVYLIGIYRKVLASTRFLQLALVLTLNFSGFFLYIASAPVFMTEHLHVSSRGFAWLFVPMIAGVMIGASISGRIAGLWSARATVGLGYALMMIAAAFNLVICSTIAPGVPWNVVPIMVFTMGTSIVMPTVTLLILELFPDNRGLASSLQAFIQFSVSGMIAGTVAPLLSHSHQLLAIGMAGFTVASFALWRYHVLHSNLSREAPLP